MIYIIYGNDTKKKNDYLKKLYKNNEPVLVTGDITKDVIFNYAFSVSLFGEEQVVIFENFIKDSDVTLSTGDLLKLKESHVVLVFNEEKLLAADIKKYSKYAVIENFTKAEIKQAPKINIFNIADSFSRKDKIGAWLLYREAISVGVQPEEVSGILFWKIKTMLLTGTSFFSKDELKRKSSDLVSLYHKAHRGELDFVIGLEQFILSSLVK